MIFLDTNIILELILKDRPHLQEVQEFLEKNKDGTAISILTAHLIMYFGRKAQIQDQLLKRIIDENEVLSVIVDDYEWAIRNEAGNDFEDALQVSTAIRNGCDRFITLDKILAKNYSSLSDITINLLS